MQVYYGKFEMQACRAKSSWARLCSQQLLSLFSGQEPDAVFKRDPMSHFLSRPSLLAEYTRVLLALLTLS